jgi:hypothetical protein
MSKAKAPAASNAVSPAAEISVSSFKDAAYKSALTGETLETIARWVNDECPAFLDDVSAEIKAELREGFALRWQELNPAKTFDSNSWIPKDNGDISVSLAYCLSYSQQAFGQLKADNAVQHGVIKKIRDDFNKYVSNKIADLKRAVRKVQNEGKPSQRVQAKLFQEYLSDTFTQMKARCKTAKARSDAEAPDEVKLRMAIDAFYATLK